MEAAQALGLKSNDRLRFVVIPQAMRVIIPPMTNQYLNLTKNSSLAAAIGYPELISVFMGTTLNQTGRAIEVVFLTMLVYLTLALSTSALMNWYNRRVALVER
jgi:general L-amino acid transport system permease protein